MPYVDLFTDPAAVRRIFVSLGLAQEHEEVHALPLTGGVSSGIYRVDLRSGSYCLKQALPRLKVAKDWRVPVDRVFAEIDYLRTVSAIAPANARVFMERGPTHPDVPGYAAAMCGAMAGAVRHPSSFRSEPPRSRIRGVAR